MPRVTTAAALRALAAKLIAGTAKAAPDEPFYVRMDMLLDEAEASSPQVISLENVIDC